MTTEQTKGAADETKKERGINELLKLDKYDGLTDGEVRTLVEYNVKVAKFDEKINVSRETATTMYETSAAAAAACCEAANQVLQSIIESHTNFEGVTPTSVTNFLTALEEV